MYSHANIITIKYHVQMDIYICTPKPCSYYNKSKSGLQLQNISEIKENKQCA